MVDVIRTPADHGCSEDRCAGGEMIHRVILKHRGFKKVPDGVIGSTPVSEGESFDEASRIKVRSVDVGGSRDEHQHDGAILLR